MRDTPAGATAVPDLDLGVITTRLAVVRAWLAVDRTASHVWPEGATYDGGEACLRCGSIVPYGTCLPLRTAQFVEARELLRDVYDDSRVLVAEVHRLITACDAACQKRDEALEQGARVTESRRVLLDAAARLTNLFSNKDALPRDVQMRIPAGGFVVSQIDDVLVGVVRERDEARAERAAISVQVRRDAVLAAVAERAALAVARVDGARTMRDRVLAFARDSEATDGLRVPDVVDIIATHPDFDPVTVGSGS